MEPEKGRKKRKGKGLPVYFYYRREGRRRGRTLNASNINERGGRKKKKKKKSLLGAIFSRACDGGEGKNLHPYIDTFGGKKGKGKRKRKFHPTQLDLRENPLPSIHTDSSRLAPPRRRGGEKKRRGERRRKS